MTRTTAIRILTLSLGLALARPGISQLAAPKSPMFPLFGVAAGQVFRFAVGGVENPNYADQTCRGTLSFRDTANRPLGSSLTVGVGPRQSAHLDLNPLLLGAPWRQRMALRPVLDFSVNSAPCQVSFEVYDLIGGRSSGWSDPPEPESPVLQDPPEPDRPVLENPPEPDFAPIGLAAGRTLLLRVIRGTDVTSPACDATLRITGPDGTILASTQTGSLAPGASAGLAVNADTLALSWGRPMMVRASMAARADALATPGSIAGCVAAAEIVNNYSQWTEALVLNH